MSGQVYTTQSVLQSLVERLARPVDERSCRRAASHVLDWLGSAALGSRMVAAQGFGNITARGASGPCQTFGKGRRDWWHALQLNAAVGNLLEMDDLHRSSILHPGPIIIPAAIVVAETVGATATQLLAAIVRGYEATIRIGRALGPSHYVHFHNTSTAGAFGAAAAAADLLSLDRNQTAWALANAGSRTGGLWQMRHEPCETKSLHTAQAAQTGVQAAWLAQVGVRGPIALLEGKQGLFAAMAAGSDAQNVLSGIADDWLIHEVSFKPWPACRHAHSTIDAALALRVRILAEARIEDIAAIEVSTYQSAVDFCDLAHPETELQAKFSLQHCAATVLLNGRPWFEHFAVENLSRLNLVALRHKVRVNVSPSLSARFPAHYGAHIRVTLADGRALEHDQPDAWGDPELPLSDAEIIHKSCLLLTDARMEKIDSLVRATLALADQGSVHAFTEAWQ